MNIDRTFPQNPIPPRNTKEPKPRTPVWAWCVIAFLTVLTLVLFLSTVAVGASKFRALPQPVKTVTVTKTITDTSASDDVQAQFDNCKVQYGKLVQIAATEANILQVVANTASDAVRSAAIGDTASLNNDTATINEQNDRLTSITSDVNNIDGSACQ